MPITYQKSEKHITSSNLSIIPVKKHCHNSMLQAATPQVRSDAKRSKILSLS